MSTPALIALGGNLGDRRAILDASVAALADSPGIDVRAVSRYLETAPVGGPSGQGPFLNAAARLQTSMGAERLLQRLREIEGRAGRIRVARWGERTLDLDLLIFGRLVLKTPELTLPHPRMAVRRFVLAPLAEIAPEFVDPLTGRTIAQLLDNLERRPSLLVLEGPEGPSKDQLFNRVRDELGAFEIREREFEHRKRSLLEHLRRAPSEQWIFTDICTSMLRDFGRAELTPTFAAHFQGDREQTPTNPDPVPRLWLDTEDPDAAASEILSACRASRV